MASEYDIEMSEPSGSRCDCCGGLTVHLTRFVHRHGNAFAIYYASYSNNHADNELAVVVSLGEWGEDSSPEQRAAFYCRVRPTADSYEVMLDDASHSVWHDVELVGAKLSREEALRHPWRATALEVLDEAFVQDGSLRAFLDRVQCGDAAVPLERNFQAPDEIWSLGDQRSARSELRRNFATLDGARFFVRCLLPVPVEDYGTWCVGLWIEVSKPDHDRVVQVWNDPVLYAQLRFSGTVANDLAADLDLPLRFGAEVQLVVPNPDSPPRIAPPETGALADLLSKSWSKAAFEQYAIARSFL